MDKITIYLSRLKQLGDSKGCQFCLITNPDILDKFDICNDSDYKECVKLPFRAGDSLSEIIENSLADRTHILVISPNALVHSVPPDSLKSKKLLIFACNSAPTSLEAIEHFLRCGEKTVPQEQESFAEKFFEHLESTEFLRLMNKEFKTEAVFSHLNQEYGWHEQCGAVDWGEQQVFPAGEIACFLVPLKAKTISFDTRLELNGVIPLKGFPIVHSGPPSFLKADQQRVFEALATIRNHPVLAKVEDGEITSLEATHASCKPVINMMQDMFAVDSRFKIIYEIGFAINHQVKLWPENSAMNEVSASEMGSIHFGLGMLPFTQYHIDIICPDIALAIEDANLT